MSRKAKFIWFLIALVFVLLLYLVMTSESIRPKNESSEEEVKQVNIVKLTAEYKAEVSRILKNYLVLVEQIDVEDEDASEPIKLVTIEQVAAIKAELFNLIVPAELKDLHADLFFSMTKMENYLIDDDLEEKIASEQLINQSLDNYTWLR